MKNIPRTICNIAELMKLSAHVEDFPPRPDEIHVQNGTLHIDGSFTPGRSGAVRSRFPVRYDPNAGAPELWLRFLSELLHPEDIPTLQEYIGYCLIPSTKGQRMMIIKGEGGEGKSQIGTVLSAVFGSSMKDGSIGKISDNRFARADLENIHLLVDDDMKMEALKQTNYVKSIVTAQGKMDLERKGVQSYQGWMYARLLAFSNGDLQGAAAGWSYSTELYRIERYTDDETQHYRYSFTLQNQGQTESTETASFTNTYTGMTYEIPFTKTVKLGGNTSPGQETFQLEIFDPGNSNLEDYDDLYTAAVTTNGSGNFEGKLVISGPAEKVDALISEGFYVREKEGSAENWTYSDAVWYVSPDWTDADNGGKELAFSLCPATLKESDNGSYYVLSENPADKMSFENVYTRNTSGGGGGYTGVTITANKTDTQGKALSGATFVLEDSRGREAYTATSNSSGVVRFTGVGSGTYTLLEKSAPDGYVSSGDSYEITVSGSRVTMNGKTYSPVTFVNKRAAELNRTDHYAFLVGYVDGTFGPERNMTRAEVTTMFARLLTEQIDANKTYTNTFTDVPSSHWASDYIGYMQQFGIITGYADGSFRPDAPVTRAEFAAIASRFEKLTEGTKSFTDVTGTYWAAKYINFAATRGWVTGYSDGTFKPENNITRAEVAAVTCRLLERSADQNYIRSHLSELRTFRDMSESHWAYWYAMEASNGHDYTKRGESETWSRTHN